ncbi:hypothetical protein LTR47_011879 [Exophiala xenobiotica]|nr:hypothetical protein LTR92_010745 [Exophiala xenobiotica]KAK5217356.1 hypothetical protein LTR47_011879 [Exophiala xenobiotica]KAK5251324.1 hypothetical protein LTS06_004081 [Exophiala xenobiotica]KAK5312461.1 hypothetical protein LTR93_011332 [Exophiala xenobiotica]KAK5352986.1 hypothetical protein LTR61_004114 [Exophiala xenobiotica]
MQRLKEKRVMLDTVHKTKMERLEAGLLKQDRTGWYNRTKWQDHFRNRNLVYLAWATRMPEKNEPVLHEILNAFSTLAIRSADSINTLDHEDTTISPRPFNRLQNAESEDRYFTYIRRFICYTCRVWEAEKDFRAKNAQRDQNSQDDEHLVDGLNSPTTVASRPTFNNVRANILAANSEYTSDENDNDSHDSDDSNDSNDGNDNDDRNDSNDNDNRDKYISGLYTPATERSNDGNEIKDVMKDARELFPWTASQYSATQNVVKSVVTFNDEIPGRVITEEGTIHAIHIFLQQFIFHKIGGEPFKSGLVHFAAVLGIDEENRRLREAVNFSYVVAGLVWSIRVLSVQVLLPAHRRQTQPDSHERRLKFQRNRREYLVDGSSTPMSEFINLLAYGKYIALNTSNAGSITWSRDGEIIYFHGLSIPLNSFRSMVINNIEHAEELLWRELMWTSDSAQRFTVDLDKLEDDLPFTRRGWSFLKRESNQLENGYDWIAAKASTQRGKRRLLRVNGTWQLRGVRRWLQHATYFLERLLFAVHSTYGPVSRGTEITAIRFRNGATADRNFFIIDGGACIITRYHKSQQLFDTPKVIPRFLPWRVGQLAVLYLVYVQPFRELLLSETQNLDPSDHIWHNDKGPWETDQLTRVIKRETALGLGHRFNTLDFRHIAIGVGRRVVGNQFGQGHKDEVGEIEEPEQEGEDPIELQSGRTEAMGASRYAVPADIIKHLSVRSLDTFRPLSEGWHRFLGLVSVHSQLWEKSLVTPARPSPVAPPTARTISHRAMHKRRGRQSWEVSSEKQRPHWRALFDDVPGSASPSTTSFASPSLPPVSGRSTPAVPVAPSSGEIEAAMHRLFGDGPVGFHSREQEEGVRAVLNAETPVTVVLPTGGGKTLLAMLPVVLETRGVSIFIAPFRALVDDMARRFRAAGIDCFEWHHGENNPARLVIVSADTAVTPAFSTYCQVLRDSELLRRVFVDECHTTFTDSHWRAKLSRLRHVRSFGCPTYLLTATLPPRRVFELEESMAVRLTRIIRASTTRPRHRYCVQQCRPGALESTALEVCRRQQEHLLRAQQKGVVYCLSRTQCEEMAAELDCAHYHAGVVDRGERLKRWVQRGGLIVATSALGTGVDIQGIVFILHIDIPWSMIDFAQESGRGGRAGETVDSLILVTQRAAEVRLQRRHLDVEAEVMAKFVDSRTCRRRVMSEYLDGPALARSCLDDAEWVRCDRCGEGEHEVRTRTRQDEEERRLVEEALTEMTIGCAYCWLSSRDRRDSSHGTQDCPWTSWNRVDVERFRQRIRYAADSHSCHRCGVSQHLCATGAEVSRACQWPSVVVPILFSAMQSESGFHEVQIAGYQAEYQDLAAYGQWLGQRHFQRIWGENTSNGMAVVLRIIRFVHDVEGARVSGQGDATASSEEDTTEGSVESGDMYQ